MSVDKEQLKQRVGLIWTNHEEREYLVGLIQKDTAQLGNVNPQVSQKQVDESAERESE